MHLSAKRFNLGSVQAWVAGMARHSAYARKGNGMWGALIKGAGNTAA